MKTAAISRFVVAAVVKKIAFAMLCVTLLMLVAAPARAAVDVHICQDASRQGSPGFVCDVTIEINGSAGNLSATITDFGSNYPSGSFDDKLIGIQNNSSMNLGAIVLSTPLQSSENLFDFGDHDGICPTCGPTTYEGPNNTFVGISTNLTTGKVLFTTPLAANGGTGSTTWFSLERAPATVVAIGEAQTLVTNQTNTFKFGASGVDDYQITPLSLLTGTDTMTVTAIPVLSGTFAATHFSNLFCVPYKDFSAAAGIPTCVEVERDCSGADCDTLLYKATLDFSIDASVSQGIGGAAFLGKASVACPTSDFDLNITTSYTGSPIDPISGTGKGGHSCFVAAYDPTAPVVAVGATVSTFFGFEFPVVNDPKTNIVFAPFPELLNWDSHDTNNRGIPDLHLCTVVNPTNATCLAAGVQQPWVHLSSIPLANCGGYHGADPLPGSFLNLSKLLGAGEYTFIWDTSKMKGPSTCTVRVQLQFSTGGFAAPATFKYH